MAYYLNQLDVMLPICYTPKVPSLEQEILNLISYTYTLMHWPGVVVLMAVGSAGIPLPSELIMPLAGWMLIKNQFLSPAYVLVAGVYGALGDVIGSATAYAVGMWGGRPFLEKYGKYILVTNHDLDLADRWFERYGSWSIFLSRLLPVVRGFISLPAGVARMNFTRFVVFTFLGSFIWSAALAYGGYQLGEHWEQLRVIMRPFTPLAITIIAALFALYIYRHVKYSRIQNRR